MEKISKKLLQVNFFDKVFVETVVSSDLKYYKATKHIF